jgi:hypothetical protein
MTESLNDVEIAAIQAFYENVGMRESVKKVILDGLYNQGVIKPGKPHDALHNRALVIAQEGGSNEEIGAKLRAFSEGVTLIEHAFNQMSAIKTKVEKQESKKNQAR